MPASAMRRSSVAERGLVGAHQAGGRLVEQQHVAAASASARAISTRRRSTCGRSPAGVSSAAVIADEGEQRLGAARRPRGCAACRRADGPSRPRRSADQHVVEHAQRAEQLGRLVGAGDAGARDLPGRRAGQLAAAEPDAAGVGAVEAADHVEHGGLAGAVGADQRW